MPFAFVSNVTVVKDDIFPLAVSLTAARDFFVRNLNLGTEDIRQWGWIYVYWNTGNPDIGRCIRSQTPCLGQRVNVAVPVFPEGTGEIWVYVPKNAALPNYNLSVYIRNP